MSPSKSRGGIAVVSEGRPVPFPISSPYLRAITPPQLILPVNWGHAALGYPCRDDSRGPSTSSQPYSWSVLSMGGPSTPYITGIWSYADWSETGDTMETRQKPLCEEAISGPSPGSSTCPPYPTPTYGPCWTSWTARQQPRSPVTTTIMVMARDMAMASRPPPGTDLVD